MRCLLSIPTTSFFYHLFHSAVCLQLENFLGTLIGRIHGAIVAAIIAATGRSDSRGDRRGDDLPVYTLQAPVAATIASWSIKQSCLHSVYTRGDAVTIVATVASCVHYRRPVGATIAPTVAATIAPCIRPITDSSGTQLGRCSLQLCIALIAV